MKPRFSNQRIHALTLLEVLVVIGVVAVLVVLVILHVDNEESWRSKAVRINCVNNLKEIGLAYRVWASDHGDKYPMFVSVTNGGVMEMAVTGDVATTFQIMSNELYTPKILICPADSNWNTNWLLVTNFATDFSAKSISYFVGLDANINSSSAFLSGDDNLEISGVPVKSGLLEFSTAAPISWTAARHKFVGNIGLADGSVQMVSNSGLTNLLHQTGLATNRLAIP